MVRPTIPAAQMRARTERKALLISARSVRGALIGVFAVLLMASAIQDAALFSGLNERRLWLLDVSAEQSIFTWAASLLIAINAIMFGLLAAGSHAHRWSWLGLSIFFFALSIDELFGLHRSIMLPSISLVGQAGVFWSFGAAAALLVIATGYGRLLASLTPQLRFQFLLALLVFAGAGAGMTMAANEARDIFGVDGLWARVPATLAEALAIGGYITCLGALLAQCGLTRLEIVMAPPEPGWSS